MFAATKTAATKLSTSAAALALAKPSRRSIAGGIGSNRLCTVRLHSTKSTATTTNAVKSLSSASASATTSTSSTAGSSMKSGSKSSSRSHTTSSVASAASSRQQQQQQQPGKFKPVYVHHVSRVALEHFQSSPNCDWLLEKGLDSRLKITPNGTFELTFPPLQEQNNGSTTAAGGKIWTSYDPQRKQHWLSVYRHKLAVRFLLKDHTAAAASPNSDGFGPAAATTGQHSMQYRTGLQQIQAAVDEMINAVDRVDHEQLNENLRKNKQQQQRRQREEVTAKQQQSSFLLKTLRDL